MNQKELVHSIAQEIIEGGGGSGNWGHKGIPGHRGGSLPTKAGSIVRYGLKSQAGRIRLPKPSRTLWTLARKSRNIEVAMSGSPVKMLKRLVNIFIGRHIARKFYR